MLVLLLVGIRIFCELVVLVFPLTFQPWLERPWQRISQELADSKWISQCPLCSAELVRMKFGFVVVKGQSLTIDSCQTFPDQWSVVSGIRAVAVKTK